MAKGGKANRKRSQKVSRTPAKSQAPSKAPATAQDQAASSTAVIAAPATEPALNVKWRDREEIPHRRNLWNNVLKAVDVEPRDAEMIHGASGVSHELLALGIDERPGSKRIIVVSEETDARSAALVQADFQAALPDFGVLLIRPVLVSIQEVATEIVQSSGRSRWSVSGLNGVDSEDITAVMSPYLELIMEIVKRWVENATSLRSFKFFQGLRQLVEQLAQIDWVNAKNDVTIDLTRILGRSPMYADWKLGICGFPLHAMSDTDLGMLDDSANEEEVRDVLRRHEVLQYFYPAPDHLALGLIERGVDGPDLGQRVGQAAHLGHPAGPMEIVPEGTSISNLLQVLKENGLAAEGEVSWEVTPEGQTVRNTVRFKPREGVVSRIANRVSVNIDLSLKDIFNTGGS